MNDEIKTYLVSVVLIGLGLVEGYLIGKKTKETALYKEYMNGVDDCLRDLYMRAEAKRLAESEVQEIKKELGL